MKTEAAATPKKMPGLFLFIGFYFLQIQCDMHNFDNAFYSA